MSDIYGLVGLVLILIGWVYELAKALKAGKPHIPLGFSLLYGAGSLLLFVHSWLLNDLVFMILNAGATIIPVINIFLIFRSKKK